jgi:hypothetical protein
MSWNPFDEIKTASSSDVATFHDLPQDLDDWQCSDWQIYHTRNKNAFGLNYANEIFLVDVGRLHSFSDMWSCKYDCDFVQYLNDNQLPYNSILTDVYCTIENATQTAENISTSIAKTSKYTLPLLAVAVAGAFFFKDDIKKLIK